MPETDLVISQIQGVTIVSFRNESILDGHSVMEIGERLYSLIDDENQKKIILDFAHVKFLSSSMIGVLIALQRKAADNKSKVVLASLREELFKIFKIMKLEKAFSFAADEKEALHSFKVFT